MSTIQRRQIQYTLSHKIESPSGYSRKDELELQSHLKLIAGYSITERNLNKTCWGLRDEVRNLRRFRNRPVIGETARRSEDWASKGYDAEEGLSELGLSEQVDDVWEYMTNREKAKLVRHGRRTRGK